MNVCRRLPEAANSSGGEGVRPADERVVVTGAAGFIGSHLVDALLARGTHVVGVDRRDPDSDLSVRAHLAYATGHAKFRFVCADLADAALTPLVEGATTVFHLAGIPGVRSSWPTASFGEYVRSNVNATHRLVAACEAAGVRRLVYASSSSVYGRAGRASTERDVTVPISPYGVTKLAGEHLCLAHAGRQETALSVVALRYFTVYGPRQRPDMAISRMLAAALSGAPYTVYGTGAQTREFTYVDDVVKATIAAAGCADDAGVVNVGGGSSASLIDVLELAAEVAGRPILLAHADVAAGDVPATSADLRKAAALLGFEPVWDLRRGMQAELEYLRRLPAAQLAAYISVDRRAGVAA